MSKHTPGPWTFVSDQENWKIAAPSNAALMCDEQYYPWCPDAEADWRLMAAAPELLEALKACIANHCPNAALFCSTCTAAREVIKKAEGA